MITDEQKSKYKISSSGIALSKCITTFIVNESCTNIKSSQSVVSNDDECLTCLDRNGRGYNYRINKCVEKGILQYLKYYSKIDLKSNGVASSKAGNPDIVVDGEYNLQHVGQIFVNDAKLYKHLFTTVSLNRILGVGGEKVSFSDPMAILREFMTDIITWVGCTLSTKIYGINMLRIESSGFEKETAINGKGCILFTATTEEFDIIVDSVKVNLGLLNVDNSAEYLNNGKYFENYFDLVWAIICTGIEQYLNKNEVITNDDGFSIMGAEVMDYEGESHGVASFGDTFHQMISIEVFTIPAPFNKKIFMSQSIDIGDINIEIEGKDFHGQHKTFKFPIIFDDMKLLFVNISTGISTFINSITNVVSVIYNNIIELFVRVGEIISNIVNALSKAIDKIMSVVEKIFTAIGKIFKKIITSLKKLLLVVFTRLSRHISWETLKKVTPVGPVVFTPYFEGKTKAKTIGMKIKGSTVKIDNAKRKVKSIDKQSKRFVTISNKIEKSKKAIDSLNGCSGVFELPTIPTLPTIDIPTQHEEDIPGGKSLDDIIADSVLPEGTPIPETPKVTSDDVEFDANGNVVGETVIPPVPIDGMLPKVDNPTPPSVATPPKEDVVTQSYEQYVSKEHPPVSDNSNYVNVKTLYTSEVMKRHIKGYESLNLKLYNDPDGKHINIGYGHVLGLVSDKDSITPKSITVDQANKYFNDDIVKIESFIKSLIMRPITQGQFDAFIDLGYNAGVYRVKNSRTLGLFNQGKICECSELYLKCMITANGVPLDGLIKRRHSGYLFFIENNSISHCSVV